jgi:hypothetical protein
MLIIFMFLEDLSTNLFVIDYLVAIHKEILDNPTQLTATPITYPAQTWPKVCICKYNRDAITKPERNTTTISVDQRKSSPYKANTIPAKTVQPPMALLWALIFQKKLTIVTVAMQAVILPKIRKALGTGANLV